MRAYLRASATGTAPALAPAAVSVAAVAGRVGLGYGIAIAVGVLVLVSTIMLVSYLCVLTKAGAAATLLAAADTAAPPSAAAVPGLDVAAIDALYPKYPHVAGTGDDSGGPCAICLGDFARGDALRRGPGCGHRLHACSV
jgi:hypothetical protein